MIDCNIDKSIKNSPIVLAKTTRTAKNKTARRFFLAIFPQEDILIYVQGELD